MDESRGCKYFPIWLLGDSNPKNWEDKLDVPLDTRHPAVHNIWTPIVDLVQETVFEKDCKRINTSRLYVRNAVEDANEKPEYGVKNWDPRLNERTRKLRKHIEEYKPKIVFSLGAFAFEFARRALTSEEGEYQGSRYWSAEKLGEQFRQRTKGFCVGETNLLPLLHVSIARGKFLEAHRSFTQCDKGNYFEYVAKEISKVLLCNENDFSTIWK
ncbi:MAG: hypothetical protein F4X65_01350 [Chloroflexi bacterium]|nr:hypothetical protein [Chloroflexota bacterium]